MAPLLHTIANRQTFSTNLSERVNKLILVIADISRDCLRIIQHSSRVTFAFLIPDSTNFGLGRYGSRHCFYRHCHQHILAQVHVSIRAIFRVYQIWYPVSSGHTRKVPFARCLLFGLYCFCDEFTYCGNRYQPPCYEAADSVQHILSLKKPYNFPLKIKTHGIYMRLTVNSHIYLCECTSAQDMSLRTANQDCVTLMLLSGRYCPAE